MNEQQYAKLKDFMSEQDSEVALSRAMSACGINYYHFTLEDQQKLKKDGIMTVKVGKARYLKKKK